MAILFEFKRFKHVKEESYYSAGGEALAEVAQRGGGCSIPGNIQGQSGWGSERPGLVEDVPGHGRRVGVDDI